MMRDRAKGMVGNDNPNKITSADPSGGCFFCQASHMTVRKISILIFIFAVTLSATAGGDVFQLMRDEAIGALKIGLQREQAIRIAGAEPKAGRIEEWGADGLFHQQLTFKNAGVSLSMVSQTKSSPQTIESITVVAPCALTTRKGVGIGSSEAEVMKAYRRQHNKKESTPGSCFIAGSTYGGIIFQIKNGKVSRIFLGAAGE